MNTGTLLALTLAATLVLSACNTDNSENLVAEHMSRSETYLAQNQFRSAMLELRNALQQNTGDIDPALKMADVLLRLGSTRQVAELLEPWLAGGKTEAALPLADAYVRQGKWLSAQETLRQANLQGVEEQSRGRRIEGDIARLAGNTDQARSLYQQAIELDNANEQAAVELVRLNLQRNQTAQAKDVIDGFLAENNATAMIQYARALVSYQRNDLEATANALTDGLGLIPTSDFFLPERRQTLSLLSRVLTEQGNMSQAMVYNQILTENSNTEFNESAQRAIEALSGGEIDTARSILETLIQQNPDNNLIGLLLGAVSVQEGDIEEGASLLADNLDAETTPTSFIRLSTLAQMDLGQREQAFATLERALLARPSDVELLAMHGVLALSIESRRDQGVESLNKALQIDKNRSRLRAALAQHYFREGQNEQGLAQMRMAFTTQPADWPVTEQYMSNLIRLGYMEEVRELRDRLATDFPDAPFANLLVALTDYRQGESEAALTRLEQLVENNPDWTQAITAMANVQAREGETETAIDYFVQAAASNPNQPDTLANARNLYRQGHSNDETVTWLTEIGNRHPSLATTSQALATQTLLQAGNISEARALLNQSQSPDDPMLVRSQALLKTAEAERAAANQEWEKARNLAAEAVSLVPENLNFHLLQTQIELAAGDFESVAEQLDSIKATFGEQPQVTLLEASLVQQKDGRQNAYQFLTSRWDQSSDLILLPSLIQLARAENPDKALTLALQWTERQPTNPQAWQTSADMQLQHGSDAIAIEHYEKALELQSNNPALLNNMAWALQESDPGRAIDLASQAVQLAPDNAALLDTYGWVQYKAGQNSQAIATLQRALELDPDNAEIKAHLDTVRAY